MKQMHNQKKGLKRKTAGAKSGKCNCIADKEKTSNKWIAGIE
jgi:hypothetical protein